MFVVCGEALMDVFANGETPTGLALDAPIGCPRLPFRLVHDGRVAGGRYLARAGRARTHARVDLLRPEHPPQRRAGAAALARAAAVDGAAHAPAEGERRGPLAAVPRPGAADA